MWGGRPGRADGSMNCQTARDDLSLLALGTLPPTEADQVRDHAATCDACRAQLLAAEEAVGALALAAPHVTAPPELRAAVLAAFHEIPAPVPLVPLEAPPDRPAMTRRRRI